MIKSFTFVLVTIAIFLFYNVDAQNNWEPGYIIDSKQDTIAGFIDYRDSRSLTESCHFKTSLQAEEKIILPGEIFGFRLSDGRYYISKTVLINNESVTLFVEYLINGIASIYHAQIGKGYFFVEKDGQLQELKNSRVQVTKENVTYEHEKHEYIGVLNSLLRDAPESMNISNVTLESKSLVKLARRYHEATCDYECIIYERSAHKSTFFMGAHAGMLLNRVKFAGTVHSGFSPGTEIGVKFGFESFEWLENLGISIGARYIQTTNYTFKAKDVYESTSLKDMGSFLDYNGKTYRFRDQTIRTDYFTYYDEIEADISIQKLVIPVMFTYRLSNGKMKPYIGLGLINEFNISQNDDFKYEDTYLEYGQSIPTYGVGFIFQLGLSYELTEQSRICLETGLGYASNMNINSFQRVLQYSVPLTLGYQWFFVKTVDH